jgi:DNA replication protein DnaC
MKNQPSLLSEQLEYLKLKYVADQYGPLADEAIRQPWDHREYLRRLIEGEYNDQRQRRVAARIKSARFPVIKTLEQFNWTWPKKINRLAVQNLFRLEFVAQNANVVFLGNVGTGKSHLATALGYAACLEGHSVLFAGAIEVINDLQAAQKNGGLKRALKKYLRPAIVILDEVGYLPIDQKGADLLFQVISQRYERGSPVNHQQALQAMGLDLQQRQHHCLSGARPPLASCRDHRYRRCQLSDEGPTGRLNFPKTVPLK